MIPSLAFSTKAMLPYRGIKTDNADIRLDRLSKAQPHTNCEAQMSAMRKEPTIFPRSHLPELHIKASLHSLAIIRTTN